MKTYKPISCDFYDYLEETATLSKEIDLEVQVMDVKKTVSKVKITDLQTKEGEEFVLLSNGDQYRLDQIIWVK